MDALKQALPHLLGATVVSAVVVVLSIKGQITGAEALTILGPLWGFSLGGSVASSQSSGTMTAPTVTVPVSVEAHTTPSSSPSLKTSETPSATTSSNVHLIDDPGSASTA